MDEAILNDVLRAHRASVDAMLEAARRSGDRWTTPPAPGKWSPSQIVEHVARSLEEGANVVNGVASQFPNLPAPLRPVARVLLVRRVLKSERFPRARTNRPFDPETGPDSPEAARVRLEAALDVLERACRSCASGSGVVRSATFGKLSVADYARFLEIHTRHHTRQMS